MVYNLAAISMNKIVKKLVVMAVLAIPVGVIAQEMACQPDQNKVAEAAMAKARDALRKTVAALQAKDPQAIDMAKIWLGVTDSNASGKLVERLLKMSVVTGGVTYRCSNQSTKENHGLFASILPSGKVGMLLGPSFWKSGDSGFDSKAGVMIHEISHLSIAGGTNTIPPYEEEIYGKELVIKLAKTLPIKAQNNAESIQLFVEAYYYGLTP